MRRLPLLALCFTLLALPASASAKPRDRDHDRMPDRWERVHKLKVAKKDGRRDADRDGLRNALEYKAGTDPRRADSDRDGIRDGAELIGTVSAFTKGVLVVKLLRGGTVRGKVDDDTLVDCMSPSAPKARSSQEPDDAAAEDESVDDATGPEDSPDDAETPEDSEDSEDDAFDEIEGDDELDDPAAACPVKKGARIADADLLDRFFLALVVRR